MCAIPRQYGQLLGVQCAPNLETGMRRTQGPVICLECGERHSTGRTG